MYKTSDPDTLSHVGLGVTAAGTSKMLARAGIWSEVWPCSSAEHLLARLRAAHDDAREDGHVLPTHVVVHAVWICTDDLAAMAGEFPNVVFVIVSHSNWGFLAADPNAVKLLREAVDLQHSLHNVRVAGNSEKFSESATDMWSTNIAWLPNLYDLTEPPAKPRERWAGDSLRLGLFGAARPLKNGTTAAAAAALLAARLRVPTELHISEGDESGAIRELTDGVPNLKLVCTGWQPWPKFRRLVSHMHLVLQPSFTESFNVVCADALHAGVPCVASEAIDWLPPHWQADADDARDVARVAEYLLRDPRAVEDGRRALRRYVEGGLGEWRRFLAPTRSKTA